MYFNPFYPRERKKPDLKKNRSDRFIVAMTSAGDKTVLVSIIIKLGIYVFVEAGKSFLGLFAISK